MSTKKKSKAKVKVLKVEKLAPNKVALALEVEDADPLPSQPFPVDVELSHEAEQQPPEAQSWMQWLKSALSSFLHS